MRLRKPLPEIHAVSIQYGPDVVRLVGLSCGCSLYFPDKREVRVIGPEYCLRHGNDDDAKLRVRHIAHRAIQ
jgi:hypothetical protein